MKSVVSSYLQAIPSLSQSRHQLTHPKQDDPCPLSSIHVLLPSNIMPGALGLPGVWGSPGLTLPLLSAFSIQLWIYRVHLDQKRQRWCLISLIWRALLVWPWTHHRSIPRVSTPSWGSLLHHALGQTGPWPHHLTCLLLSCLSTLGTDLVWNS